MMQAYIDLLQDISLLTTEQGKIQLEVMNVNYEFLKKRCLMFDIPFEEIKRLVDEVPYLENNPPIFTIPKILDQLLHVVDEHPLLSPEAKYEVVLLALQTRMEMLRRIYYIVREQNLQDDILKKFLDDVILVIAVNEGNGFDDITDPYLTAGFIFLEHAERHSKEEDIKKEALLTAENWFGNTLRIKEEEWVFMLQM